MKALLNTRGLPRDKEFKIAELQLKYDEVIFNHQRKGSHGLPEIKNNITQKEPPQTKKRLTKIIQHNNKYKNIENISEISIENFKNKLFLKKQDKLDDIMDSFHYKNFCSESKSKKSKFYKKSHSKFNSPKIFLKNDLEDKFSPKKKSAPEIEFKLDSKNKSLSPIKTRDLTQNNEVSFKLNKLSKFSLCSELEIKEKNSIKEKKINWKIGEKLAEGLTSTIFKALNTNDGSTLVIKKFNSNTNEKIINNYKVSKFKIE